MSDHTAYQKAPKLDFAWHTNDMKLTAERPRNLRSSSPYSMVEAEIADSMYTPPSSDVRAIRNPDENAFVDDSFDVASFRGRDFGSHAASHKTQGSYIKSKEDWCSTPSDCLCSLCQDGRYSEGLWEAKLSMPIPLHTPSEAKNLDGWNLPSELKSGWNRTTSTTKSSWPQNSKVGSQGDRQNVWGSNSAASERAYYQQKARRTPSDPFAGLYSAPQNQQFANAEAGRAYSQSQLDRLSERMAQQEEDLQCYKRMAIEAQAAAKAPHQATHVDNMTSIASNDLDFLRICLSNGAISHDEHYKALGILSERWSGHGGGAKSRIPLATTAPSNNGADVHTNRVESQITALSRDIIKMKAYDKFQRMRQDSDRLARIESKLFDVKAKDTDDTVPIVKCSMSDVQELSARLSDLQQSINHETFNHDIKNQIEELGMELRELRRSIEIVHVNQRSGEKWFDNEFDNLRKRFEQVLKSKEKSNVQGPINPREYYVTSSSEGRRSEPKWASSASSINSSRNFKVMKKNNLPGWAREDADSFTNVYSFADRRMGRSPSIAESASVDVGWGFGDRSRRGRGFAFFGRNGLEEDEESFCGR